MWISNMEKEMKVLNSKKTISTLGMLFFCLVAQQAAFAALINVTSMSREVSIGGCAREKISSDVSGVFNESIGCSSTTLEATAVQSSNISVDSFSGMGNASATNFTTNENRGTNSDGISSFFVVFTVDSPIYYDLEATFLANEFSNDGDGFVFSGLSLSQQLPPTDSNPYGDIISIFTSSATSGAGFESFTSNGVLDSGAYFFSVASTASSTRKSILGTDINGGSYEFNLNFQPVPVPTAVWLFTSGLIGLIGFAKRKKA